MSEPVVMVADDHPMFREALKVAVTRVIPGATLIEAGQLGDAVVAARATERLDLILLDLRMPGAEGFSGIALMHAERPDTPILVVSSADDAETVSRVKAYGAIGFASKTADLATIEAAIRSAYARDDRIAPPGEAHSDVEEMARRIAGLTSAELRVLTGVLAGRLNKQIAFDLGITEATVKGHMTVIMRKMNVRNRTQAVLAARALDLELDG